MSRKSVSEAAVIERGTFVRIQPSIAEIETARMARRSPYIGMSRPRAWVGRILVSYQFGDRWFAVVEDGAGGTPQVGYDRIEPIMALP